MIEVLFGSLDDAVLPRTRQSVALMFSHGLRRRGYIKVQEDSAHYWHKSWSCRVRDDRSIHSLFSLTLRIPEVSLNVSNH
ncbi:hypothetical protein ACKFKF_04810 [Phormidesmis sp. 146-12]